MTKHVSDVHLAPVMATIATSECGMTRLDLIARHAMVATQVDNIIRELTACDYVTQKPGAHRVKAGRRPLVPMPTQHFWNDYNKTLKKAASMLGKDAWLHREAVTELCNSTVGAEKNVARRRAYSNFLGRTALLAEDHDLADMGAPWFARVAGWRALVTIQVLHA